MCGRYTLSTPGHLIAEYFEVTQLPGLAPRFNIAPTQEAPVVQASAPGRQLVPMRWGLVPPDAASPAVGSQRINARSETVRSRASFADSFAHRRCLVPADGFFEWTGSGRYKQPHHIRRRDRQPFGFAGLWSSWVEEPGDRPLLTFAVLTCPPNEVVAPLHDRMPVILPSSAHSAWLSAETEPDELLPLLRPFSSAEMEAAPVSTRVNSVVNDDPACLGPPEQASLF